MVSFILITHLGTVEYSLSDFCCCWRCKMMCCASWAALDPKASEVRAGWRQPRGVAGRAAAPSGQKLPLSSEDKSPAWAHVAYMGHPACPRPARIQRVWVSFYPQGWFWKEGAHRSLIAALLLKGTLAMWKISLSGQARLFCRNK